MHPKLKVWALLGPLCGVSAVWADTAMAPVVVTATRQAQALSELLADVTVIEAEALRNAGPLTSLGEFLSRLPGVEFKQSGGPGTTSSLFVRGSNSSHVLLLVDGMRVGSVTAGLATWEMIPLEQVERIEIVRGSASALYGSDAIGGVVQIFTQRGQAGFQPRAEVGLGSYNTRLASAGLSGGQGAWRYNLQMSDKRSDGFSAIRNPANTAFNPDKDGQHHTSGSGGVSFTPAQGHELGLQFLATEGWARYDGGGWGSPAQADYNWKARVGSLVLSSRNALSSRWTSTVRVGHSLDKAQGLKDGQREYFFNSTQTQYQWQNDIQLPLGMALWGVERLDQKTDTSSQFPVNARRITALWAGWTGHWRANSLQFNARHDRNSQFGRHTTGTVAFGHQFSESWRAHASWASAFKAPTFNDLYDPYSGNAALKPESAINRELAVHYETEAQHLSLTHYRNTVKDLIQWAPNASGAWAPANVAQAQLRGWTLAYGGTWAGNQLSASVDWQSPRDAATQKILAYRARKTLKLGLGRTVGAWHWGADLDATGPRFVNAGHTGSLGGYGLLNLQSTYRLNADWSVFARFNNVFNKAYERTQDYGTPGANVYVGLRYAPK